MEKLGLGGVYGRLLGLSCLGVIAVVTIRKGLVPSASLLKLPTRVVRATIHLLGIDRGAGQGPHLPAAAGRQPLGDDLPRHGDHPLPLPAAAGLLGLVVVVAVLAQIILIFVVVIVVSNETAIDATLVPVLRHRYDTSFSSTPSSNSIDASFLCFRAAASSARPPKRPSSLSSLPLLRVPSNRLLVNDILRASGMICAISSARP